MIVLFLIEQEEGKEVIIVMGKMKLVEILINVEKLYMRQYDSVEF